MSVLGLSLLRRCLVATVSPVIVGASALPAHAEPAAPACRRGDAILVVSRERDGEVGEDIYVRKLPDPTTDQVCVFAPKPSDWTVGKGEPDYVLGVAGRFLVLDSGTGPLRRLKIVDALARKKLVDASYDDRKEKIAVSTDAIGYWRIEPKPVKAAKCPAAWRASNKSAKQAHRTSEVRFAIAEGKPRDTGATDCVLTEDDVH